MDDNTLGKRITDLLKRNGITQRELAERIGVTEATMSRYINNERMPKGPVIANIAYALHTSSDYLLGTEEKDDFENEYNQIHRLIMRNVSKMSKNQRNMLIQALLELDFN